MHVIQLKVLNNKTKDINPNSLAIKIRNKSKIIETGLGFVS